jgi:hypothetical protein
MAYRRTVRCRYCYKTGHNQRGCPDMKSEAAKNPDGWAARKVASYSTSVADGGRARSCSYCHETGHNRKTCNKLIVDFSNDMKKCADFRKNILQNMMKTGFGVGALVESRYYRENSLQFVSKIDWMNITHLGSHSVYLEDDYSSYDIKMEKFNIITNTYEDYYYKIASGISPELVQSQVPDEWFSGRSPYLNEKYGIK